MERIVIGSGDLYIKEFDGDTIPDTSDIAVAANRLGWILGGATLEYTPTKYTVKDDMGHIAKTILTNEEVKLKSGVLSWDGGTLAKLCSTARVTEAVGKRTVKIGGIKNDNRNRYVLCFVHEDAVDGDISIRIVGQNQSGFSLAFVADKETTVDAEFIAHPMDEDGTLVIYEEDDVTITA
ncbi:MAG: hypothetical protein U0N08_01800 [Oscillospiraceae bacterium]